MGLTDAIRMAARSALWSSVSRKWLANTWILKGETKKKVGI